MHHETPDLPYLPPESHNRSAASSYLGTGFSMVQVNVDSNGQNILGDAANEPSIAIDPTNPDKMAIGWRQFDNVNSNFRQAGYGYTIDGGITWRFPAVIKPGTFRSDPVLESDSEGNFYYDNLTFDYGLYVCEVFKSTNGGASWNNGRDAYGGDKEWMTVDRSGGPGDGNIYSFWTADYSSCIPGFFTRSTNGAYSFENCIGIPGNPYWGTLSIGNDGELYIAGADSADGIVVVKSTTAQYPGTIPTWDFVSHVGLDGFLNGFLSVNPGGFLGQAIIDVDRSEGPGRGNVYVLASVTRASNADSADVMFARSTDGGVTWSPPKRINDDQGTDHYQWFGTMSVAPNGRIDAIWLDTRDTPPDSLLSALYYSYSEDQGETWSVNLKLSPQFDSRIGWPQQNKLGDYFDMESDANGAHLAWANTFNDEQDVYYSYITPPGIGIRERDYRIYSLTNYPNPFYNSTTIRYKTPVDCFVVITLFDILGKEIKTLIQEKQLAGIHSIVITADDFPYGYYFCRLQAGSHMETIGLVKCD
ncbi:MAG: T9SS type A sorting domain-containing protein [Bacteroidales bacterium]|nr:T9SS type A sorting domain-containing protein [Bacteroidales bacterium]